MKLLSAIERVPLAWLALAVSVSGGLLAVYFGFQPDWDLLNYHLYNPHALVHGRHAIDLAPAQGQTFLNPLFHLPYYLGFRYLHTSVLVFLTGMAQCVQWLLLVVLLRQLTGPANWPGWVLWLTAGLGLTGPIFIAELGGSQGDTLLSGLVLAGLILIVQAAFASASSCRAAGWAGVLVGVAAALKLVIALYAVALFVAIVLCVGRSRRWPVLWPYALGCMAGFLLAGGGWFAYLWLEYQNPFFPYFNQWFQSPWITTDSFRDLRFMPVSLVDWLAYPLVWLNDPHRVWEMPFRDLRMVLLYPALLLGPLLAWRWLGRERPALRLLLVFGLCSYGLWLAMFSIYRYLAVLEMLAPLLLLSCAACWCRSGRCLFVLLVLLLATQWAVEYPRHQGLPELQTDSPSSLANLPPDAMLVIDGYEPVAFTALWLDDAIPMVRIRANFMQLARERNRLAALAEQKVSSHLGPVYLLLSANEWRSELIAEDLPRLGFQQFEQADCQPVFLQAGLQQRTGLQLCRLRRAVAN